MVLVGPTSSTRENESPRVLMWLGGEAGLFAPPRPRELAGAFIKTLPPGAPGPSKLADSVLPEKSWLIVGNLYDCFLDPWGPQGLPLGLGALGDALVRALGPRLHGLHWCNNFTEQDFHSK